jgi:hypothetical protein
MLYILHISTLRLPVSSFGAEDTEVCHFFGDVQFFASTSKSALNLPQFNISHLLLNLYIPCSVIVTLNFLHLRFFKFYCSDPLSPEETLLWDLTALCV